MPTNREYIPGILIQVEVALSKLGKAVINLRAAFWHIHIFRVFKTDA